MTAELEKTYDPAAVEAETYRVWLEENCFLADPAKAGEPYSIVIPPPNVTGALHLGHAINNTLQDILTRVHRMRGFNTVWIPGIDHAGIATQAVVEKQLKENENKTRHDVGRENLVERIWAWKQQYGDRILSQLQRLGCSCDWSRTRFTLDEMCARAVRETFFKLFKDGLIYRGKRLVNWDTHLLTSISDDELYDEPVKTNLWSIKYPINGGDEFIIVATTRPETMLADTAVAYHSSNPRAAMFKGKSVRLPLTNRLVPLIEDDILVDPEFGTGYVKVTPAHDANDYAVYQRHLGKPTEIGILNLMTPDGKVNDADPSWSQYTGLTFATARKKIVEDLAAAGLHNPETDVKPHEANVKFSDRSKTAIQPYLSDQWFVKMAPLAEPALEVVRDGTIKFFPERHAQQYLSWLGEKRDWPISRQLWWGHRIPIWTKDLMLDAAKDPGYPHDETLAQLIEEALDRDLGESSTKLFASTKSYVQMCRHSEIEHAVRVEMCIADEQSSLAKKLEAAGFVQDPDVLDTWFSSALWPHSTLGWPDQTADLAKWYPTSVLMTGRDIITLWVARMVMMGLYNLGERSTFNAQRSTFKGGTDAASDLNVESWKLNVERLPNRGIPFHHVAINPTILDGKGERMSKSKGNGVDPVDIIDTHGADALRFTLTNMATETQDVRMPVKKDSAGRNTSDKFDLGRNFCTKLWNASKFALSNIQTQAVLAEASTPVAGLADLWILSRFNRAVADSNAALLAYRFDQYARACYDFFWRDFCDWYVEAAKPAMKDPVRSASTANVLTTILDGILRLMHPMIPFITERIWWQLNAVRPAGRSKRLIHATWPTAGEINSSAEETFGKLQEVIVAIRNVRNEYKIDPKKPVTVSLSVSGQFKSEVETNRELIEVLAVCTIAKIDANLAAPANSARATAAGIDLFVEGVIDPDAEKNRTAKEIEKLTREIAALKGRLANPSYADKAPAHLVQQTRDELAAKEAELKKLQD
jgi:valyl-tRNA synthetase